MNLFSFQAKTINGQEISLEIFRGKVLLVVNVASQCGFTSQYEGLERLYEKYRPQGFEVLGFPCNQFGHQEPGSEEEIKTFCETRFSVQFPLFAKIEVKGPGAHPLFQALCEACPGILGTESVKWNFTKFLINSNGNPIRRYAPNQKPESIEPDIQELLKNSPK